MPDDDTHFVPLLLFWDNTGEGFRVTIQVTPDDTVSANGFFSITTNGHPVDLELSGDDLKNFSHKLAAEQTIIGTIVLTYTTDEEASARIVGTCLDAAGSVHQTSYDSIYTKTGPSVQPVGVSAT